MSSYDEARAQVRELLRVETETKKYAVDPLLSPEDLEALSNAAVEDLNEQNKQYGLAKEDASAFTCWKCRDASRCPYVFDDYNTGGDCLASK